MAASVLVTGAGGFIGRHVCSALLRHGMSVVGLTRRPASGAWVQHVADLGDAAAIRELLAWARPDFVVHLAASKSKVVDAAGFRSSYDANLGGTLNLVEACVAASSISRFVHVGSCEEYGNAPVPFTESVREAPLTAYGVSKLAVAHLLQAFAANTGFPVTLLRPTLVYGPGQDGEMFVPAMIDALLHGREFKMSQGRQTRDYVYVDDVVRAIVLAIHADVAAGSIINIASGVPVAMRDIAGIIARFAGPQATGLLSLGTRDVRAGEAAQYWANMERAATLLRWSPQVSLEEGIARTWAHARSNAIGSGEP